MSINPSKTGLIIGCLAPVINVLLKTISIFQNAFLIVSVALLPLSRRKRSN